MYRRVVSLLLLPCMLLTQSAAFGHAHGGGQPAGHDLRPHVHTNPLAVDNHHAHDHSHDASGGHHCHHDDVKDAPKLYTQLTPQPKPLSDHDSDAVYVNATDAVVVERPETTVGFESSYWWIAGDADLLAKCWAGSPVHWVFSGHPPPLDGQICPLYIRYLTLLI